MKINSCIIAIIGTLFLSCQSSLEKATRAEKLMNTLGDLQKEGTLFGHQDDLAYGKNWSHVAGESDVKQVSGDYPAVCGWELGGLERDDLSNLNSISFDNLLDFAIDFDSIGGINSFCWHPYSLVNGENSWNTELSVVEHMIPSGKYHQEFKAQLDKLAHFLLQLKDSEGEAIPFIFRPWHEMNGEWFWWGPKFTSSEDFKVLFRFTIQYLKAKGVDNMIVCYSPNGGFQSEEEYLTWYPGDDVVDMLGLDEYEWSNSKDWVTHTQAYLNIMIKLAQEKEKLAAFSETGCENIEDLHWFTQKLGVALAPDSIAQHLCYVLVWRNDPIVHHFFPFEGAPSAEDARTFLADPSVYLLSDFNNKR